MPSFCFSSRTTMHCFIKQETGLKFAQAPQRPQDPAWTLITNHPGLKDEGGNIAFQHHCWYRGNAEESELDTRADSSRVSLQKQHLICISATKGACGLAASQRAGEPGVGVAGSLDDSNALCTRNEPAGLSFSCDDCPHGTLRQASDSSP